MAQIFLGTSAFIFHSKMVGKKFAAVLVTGIVSTASGATFLLFPFLNVNIPVILEILGVFLWSYGIIIFVDVGVACNWFSARLTNVISLFLVIVGLISFCIVIIRGDTDYTYLSVLPLLSGGIALFSVLGRKKYGGWMLSYSTP
ncbi:MAG: hypothetical protein ACYCT2_03845 [Thermoplasmataceae archaeon]